MNDALKSAITGVLKVTALAWSLSTVIVHADEAPAVQDVERIKKPSAEERERLRSEHMKLSPEEREAKRREAHEKWQSMSPEERQRIRDQMREHWHKMPAEEREAMRQRGREHVKNLSPEERQKLRQEMLEHKRQQQMPPAEDSKATR